MALDEKSGKYAGLSREQLVHLLEKRDRQKKLGLVWERDEIEADKAVDANFVSASIVHSLCEGSTPWNNLVIEADNFDAMRWLRMGFAGRIKCIYIDPPYNTGNKDWVYNDHYFETNDRYRHSTWLEFLYRRINLARDLLTEDGVILVSINDDNHARMDLLLEEALPGMRVGSFVWRTKDSANDADKNFSSVHEHVLVYGNRNFSFLGYELDDKKYKNPDNDPRGKYSSDPITQPKTLIERANGYYPIQDPDTGWWYPCSPDSVWRYASEKIETPKKKLRSETIEALIKDKRIIFPAKSSVEYASRSALLQAIRNGTAPVDGNGRQLLREELPNLDFWIGKPIALGRPSKKAFWDEKKSKLKPVSSLIIGSNEKPDPEFHEIVSEKQGKATGEVQQIFGSKVFNYPKPSTLMKSLIEAVAGPGEIILDFFAGSATSAQAVMELNAEDDGNRRFIMVSSKEATQEEPEKNLCRDVTAKRIRLLNASNDSKYADLRADFAYLKTQKIDFENFDYDINPGDVWNILELIHDLPLTLYSHARAWNEHSSDVVTLIYADKTSSDLIARIHELLEQRRSLFVYSWAPGQLEQQMAGRDLEILPVHETLVKRFQQ